MEVALRGIDEAFDKYEARQRSQPNRRLRQVNGLAWCAQAVMEAAEQQKEAAIGASSGEATPTADAGFESRRIAAHLTDAAAALERAAIAQESMAAIAGSLQALAASVQGEQAPALEELERRLTTLEEKLFASLTAAVPEELLLEFKTEAARDLAGYRSRMGAVQIRQIEQQFVHKRLLEQYQLPRLSLFYMRQDT